MTDAPSPHDVPETEDAFFDRIAVQMAELEFRRNLRRDQPKLFEPGQQHHRRHNLDMLTLYYAVNREAAATGRTIMVRILPSQADGSAPACKLPRTGSPRETRRTQTHKPKTCMRRLSTLPHRG